MDKDSKESIMEGISDDEPPLIFIDRHNRMDTGNTQNKGLCKWKSIISFFFGISRNNARLMGVPSICGWK